MNRWGQAVLSCAVVCVLVAACSSGGGQEPGQAATDTSQRPSSTQRPTTTVPRTTSTTTTTQPVSPLDELMAGPHTAADCIDVFANNPGESFMKAEDCVRSAGGGVVVRDGFRLEVEGNGTALITYSLKGGNIAQEQVPLPWTLDVDNPYPDGQQLIAQLENSGDVTCRILSPTDAKLSEVSSSGAFVIASCNHDPVAR